MRLACPSCSAEYEVPSARLTPPRMVRCTRCGGEWIAGAEPEEWPPASPAHDSDPDQSTVDPSLSEPAPQVTATDRLASHAPPPRRSTHLIAAWVMSFVVLSGAVVAVLVWRQPLVRTWPPIGRVLGTADHEPPPQAPGSGNSAKPPLQHATE